MQIRFETPGDIPAIKEVEAAAFPTAAEADLVDQLRADGDLVFSLVAVEDATVIGHAAFSRMRAPTRALGLGPVAVLEPHRRRGVARRLIETGLDHARTDGWACVFVLGDLAYYGRFGFDPVLAAGFASPYAGPHLMGLELRRGALAAQEGPLSYAKAFEGLG